MASTVRILNEGIKALGNDRGVAQEMRGKAEEVAGRVRLPRGMTLQTRAGVGPRGAFSQVQMFGRGALAVEYGTRRMTAKAPLRRALGTVR